MQIFREYVEDMQELRVQSDLGDFSVTELQEPPYLRKLKQKYREETELTIDQCVMLALGSAMHEILFKTAEKRPEKYRAEERLFATIDGLTISGKYDRYDIETKILHDYKLTKYFPNIIKKKLDHWKYQVNLYRILMQANGIEVQQMFCKVIFRDYSKNANYPEHAWLEEEIPYIENKEVIEYFRERIRLHQTDDSYCTSEERFEESETYSVYKKDGVKACPGGSGFWNIKDAETYLEQKKNSENYEIRKIESSPKRCLYYCEVANFCEFFQEWIKNND